MWECDLFDEGCVNRFFRRWSERGGVFEVGLETKYRDIADVEHPYLFPCFALFHLVQNRKEYSHVLTRLNSLNKGDYSCYRSMKKRPDFDYLENYSRA